MAVRICLLLAMMLPWSTSGRRCRLAGGTLREPGHPQRVAASSHVEAAGAAAKKGLAHGFATLGGDARTSNLGAESHWQKEWEQILDARRAARRSAQGLLATSASQVATAHQEVEIMRALAAPQVIALREAKAADGQLLLLAESHDGTLYDQVVRGGAKVSLDTKIQLLADLLSGLERAAAAGYVHRDVSPWTLAVFGNCSIANSCRLKVGGFASVCSIGGPLRACRDMGPAGSWPYVAPEVLRQGAEDPARDVWAAALVFYAMLSSDLPVRWSLPQGALSEDSVLNDLRMEAPELASILQRMLARDPRERSSAREALRELRSFARRRGVPVLEELDGGAPGAKRGAAAARAAGLAPRERRTW